MAPSGRASESAGSYHRFMQQSMNRETRALTSAHMRRKGGESGGLGRSASTPSVCAPWALHDVPEEAPACLPAISGGAGEAYAAQPMMRQSHSSGGLSCRTSSSRGSMPRSSFNGRGGGRNCPASSSGSSLRNGADLVFFNDRQRQRAPSRPTSESGSVALTSLTSVSQMSLRREVAEAVQEEVARAVRPLQERLRQEREKREEAEASLHKATTPLLA